MNNQIKYLLKIIVGIITILFSTPLGYFMINTIYANQNLTNEYNILLNGFIHSFMLVGTLVFIFGIVGMFVEKYRK